jgi:hypothetical protein
MANVKMVIFVLLVKKVNMVTRKISGNVSHKAAMVTRVANLGEKGDFDSFGYQSSEKCTQIFV